MPKKKKHVKREDRLSCFVKGYQVQCGRQSSIAMYAAIVVMSWHHWSEGILYWSQWPGWWFPLMESMGMCLWQGEHSNWRILAVVWSRAGWIQPALHSAITVMLGRGRPILKSMARVEFSSDGINAIVSVTNLEPNPLFSLHAYLRFS